MIMNKCSLLILFLSKKVMQSRVNASESRQFKTVFPNTLNANDTLFGGQALQWMDELAFITATRFTRQRMFTVNTEPIRFLKPIPANALVELVGRVCKVGSAKLSVGVEIFVESMYGHERYKAVEGVFVFAALDEYNRPQRLNHHNKTAFGLLAESH
jgi:acyl-CoA hydrolase